MWSLMTDVCKEMGVRIDVPFRELTEREKDIVYHGPAEKSIFSIIRRKATPMILPSLIYNVPIVMDSLVGSIESDMGIKAT